MPFWKALIVAIKAAWRAWCKARPIPVRFKTGLSDPTLARMDSGTGDPELQIPEDETQDVLYRDQYGNYATETEIRLGLSRLQGTFVFAETVNDEAAMDLVERMDALELDAELTPKEKKLRDLMKKKLLEREV